MEPKKSTMKPLKNKEHRHKFEKIVEWVTQPLDEEDKYRYFSVVRTCECGTTKRGESEPSEVEEFIKDLTCSSCGSFGKKHKTQSDCIHDLHSRVLYLEKRLEKVCDVLKGID